MKRIAFVLAVLLCIGLMSPIAGATPQPGEVQTLKTYNPDAFELPEGLAIDKRGNIFLTMTFLGELRRIGTDGTEEVFAHLPTGGGFGPTGLAVDAIGNVYAAVVTGDPATQGVYRITRDGTVSRLAGTDAIGFANGLAFGDRGDLFVGDSTGKVWRIPRAGSAELWASGPLFEGDGSFGLGFPIGANGVAYRHGTLFVTNSEQGSLVSVPVLPDGSAGTPEIFAQDPLLGGVDGIALDVHGGIYLPVIAQSTIVYASPDGSSLEVIADGDDGLDWASSATFGTAGDERTLYIVNFSTGPFFGGTRTHGPALLSMDVGVPGIPLP
jgi:sugar lactone lactonase YvrE